METTGRIIKIECLKKTFKYKTEEGDYEAMKKRVLSVVLSLTLLLSMTACSVKTEEAKEEKKETKTEESTEPIKIVVGESYRSELWGAQYIAEALGYYEEEGLDVELTTLSGSSPAAALFSDEIQFLFFGSEAIPMFNTEGQNCKILLGCNSRIAMSLVGSPSTKSVADLKGKVVSAAEPGSSPRAFTYSALSQAGLDPENDVTYVSMQVFASAAALAEEQIQCAYASGSLLDYMVGMGCNVLVDTSNPETHKAVLGSEDYTTHVAIASDKFIKENPEACQKFVNAVYKAILWIQNHSAEEIAEVLSPYFEGRGVEAATIQQMLDDHEYNVDGTITKTAYDAMLRQDKTAGWITEDMEYSENVDDSFLKKAQKEITLE